MVHFLGILEDFKNIFIILQKIIIKKKKKNKYIEFGKKNKYKITKLFTSSISFSMNNTKQKFNFFIKISISINSTP